METERRAEFEGWAILELMGHRRLAGYLRAEELASATFIRIDVPGEPSSPPVATQYYAPTAVYAITPVSEAAARAVARLNRPEPVTVWELPAPRVDEPGDDPYGA